MDTMKAKARKPFGAVSERQLFRDRGIVADPFEYRGLRDHILNYKKNLINVLHTASMMGVSRVWANLCFLIGARDFIRGALAALVKYGHGLAGPLRLRVAVAGGLTVGAVFGPLTA